MLWGGVGWGRGATCLTYSELPLERCVFLDSVQLLSLVPWADRFVHENKSISFYQSSTVGPLVITVYRVGGREQNWAGGIPLQNSQEVVHTVEHTLCHVQGPGFEAPVTTWEQLHGVSFTNGKWWSGQLNPHLGA